MPAAEWFEFSSLSPSAGILSQIQEKADLSRLWGCGCQSWPLYVDWPSDPVAAEGADL